MNRFLKQYKSLSVVAKATIWFVFCSVIQKCISFITVPIFTRIMTQEQYGIYNTYLSIASVVTVICTLNFESCGYINGITKEDKSRHSDIALNLLDLSAVITMIVAAIYLVFHRKLNEFFGVSTLMMLLMFVEILFLPAVRFWSYKQRFEYKYTKLVVVTLAMTIMNSILGIVFIMLADSNNQALLRIASTALVQLFFGLSFYIIFAIKSKKIFVKENWLASIKLHLPLIPHNLSMSLLYTSDRIMISKFCGSEQTAIYSVSYSAGMVVQTLKTCIVDAIRPWIYSKIKEKNTKSVKETVTMLMIVVALLSFAFSLFAPEIIAILAPSEYGEAVYVIPPVAGSSFFMFIYHLFVSVETYYEKTGKIMEASISAAVLNIVLNLLLIPNISYIAAGYTTLVSYGVLTFLHYRNVIKLEEEYLDGNHLFDKKAILWVSIFVLGLIILVSFVYNFPVIRFSLIGGLIVLALVFRQKLFFLIELIKKK